MIVVCMTSWVKRIANVKRVVESIMENTIQPDKVYLSLSIEEFPNKELDLPIELCDYFNSDSRLIFNWVEGENTKTMKKIFPVLKYLQDEDIIINADDDILFPKDLIESRIEDFEKYGRKYSVTSNKSSIGIFKGMNVVSPISLYTKQMLKNWEKYVNDEIIKTYNDDRTYAYMLWLNGYLNKCCTKYDVKELLRRYSLSLNETSISASKQVTFARNYDVVANKRIQQITDKNISEMFGFFRDEEKHDCVMVYSKSGINSQEMNCGEYLEMEYVIASLKKYCSSWVGRIFIVGSEPPERVKNDVIHIPCDNPYTHCKDANIIHKIRYACENIKDLSDDFLMLSDDQIVTKESSWEDMKPRIVRMYSDWTEEKWEINRKIDNWHEYLYETLKLFPKDKVAFWEPHIWSPINKYKFIEMCKIYNYKEDTNCITLSLYYNFIEMEPIKGFDHLHVSTSKSKIKMRCLSINELPRHISWTDDAFIEKRFRDTIDVVVGFKESISNNSNLGLLHKIRDDIKNGNIVKEMKPDGTYIWKRVKK